jgi:xylulokinase
MSADPLLAGIDVGTTNTKAVIFDRRGRAVSQASLPTPTHYPRPGWAFYRPQEIWKTTADALSEATGRLDNPSRIAGVAIASMAEAAVPIDADGAPTYDAIAWFDRRTRPQAERLERDIGREELWRITGLSLQPIFGLCKLLWIKENEPQAFARTRRWLNMADFIGFRLCDVAATDYSLASRVLALDLEALEWDEHLLTEVGISPGIFAPLRPSGSPLGKVTARVAEETGLTTDVTVSTGGHDHVCGALATRVVDPGTVLDSMGTAEALFVPLEDPLSDPQLSSQGYTQGAHVVPERYYVFGGMYTSGACVDWVRELVGRATHEELSGEASAVPPGSLGVCFLPHLRLASPPYDDPRARGAFVGLSTDVDRAVLYRSVLEGIAFDFRNSLEPLARAGAIGDRPHICAIGGSARNELLMRIKASVLDEPITVAAVEEATSLGAAILSGVAAGVWPDVSNALSDLDYAQARVDPDPDAVSDYDDLFRDVYQKTYPALRSLHHAIDDLEGRRSSRTVGSAGGRGK